MSTKILCVDDDANVLAGFQRSLRRQFAIDTALGGEPALASMKDDGPYAVIVADMNMPEMNGIQFLMRAREVAPDSVRFMLTGNADQKTAIEAVNQGYIFRFLTKPCPPSVLAGALQQGIKQYQLITAERELLEQTLNGSIKLLVDVLSIVDPQSFGVGQKLRDYARTFAESIHADKTWELELAAMLSQIGYVTLPPVVLQKYRAGFGLTGPEKDMLLRLPEVAAKLIANIPRLENVAQIVLHQHQHFDGAGFPPNTLAGEAIPAGARIVKVLLDLVELEAKGLPRFKALDELRTRQGWYDPKVLEAAYVCFDIYLPDGTPAPRPTRSVSFAELQVGHVLAAKLETTSGVAVAGVGTEISQMVLEKLHNFAQLEGIREPIVIKERR